MSNILAIMGGIQQPDVIGSLYAGQRAGQAQMDMQNQNALRGAMQQHGAAAMQGDKNALAALAQYDPQYAMGLQSEQQNMALRQNADKRADASLGIDRERLDIARQQIRQQSAQRAAEAAQRMSEQERAQKIAEGQRTGQMVAAALRQGPEAWDQLNDSIPGMADVPFDQAEMAIASIEGALEGFGAFGENVPTPKGPVWSAASPDVAAQYGAQAGQINAETGQFQAINPPSGMTIESDGQGGFTLAQGPGVQGKPLNEGQSKNVIFATRAEGALQELEPVAGALTSRAELVAEEFPLGMARGMQSPEYQQALQSGTEFLQAILRKDTGASITPQEQVEYGKVYLPQPGDGPEVQAQKARSRARAVEALRRGMTPSEILALEKPMGGEIPQSAMDAGIDPDLWQYMSPEDQALWSN